jgi:hypothetical protein
VLSSVVVAALPAATATAQDADLSEKVDQAVKLIEDKPLNYLEAQRLLFEVVRSGEGSPDVMSLAYFTLGRVEAALEHGVESTDSFYLALMIQPSLFLPEGTSPKVRDRLNEARSRVIEVGVLEASLSLVGGVLELHLDNDPLGLVKKIEVVMSRGEGESARAELDKSKPRIAVDSDVEGISVVLFDELGNQLRVLELDPSDAESSDDINRSTIAGPSTIWENWGLWAGVAGVMAAGGAYFIMESGSLQGDLDDARAADTPDPTAVQRLEDSKDRVGLYGVVGLGLAGAAAVASGALLILGGNGPAGVETSDAAFVPSVGPGHVGAQFSLTF